eukprot:2309434-Heterocapsa_arctica.AAC.1
MRKLAILFASIGAFGAPPPRKRNIISLQILYSELHFYASAAEPALQGCETAPGTSGTPRAL